MSHNEAAVAMRSVGHRQAGRAEQSRAAAASRPADKRREQMAHGSGSGRVAAHMSRPRHKMRTRMCVCVELGCVRTAYFALHHPVQVFSVRRFASLLLLLPLLRTSLSDGRRIVTLLSFLSLFVAAAAAAADIHHRNWCSATAAHSRLLPLCLIAVYDDD